MSFNFTLLNMRQEGCILSEVPGECIITVGRNCHMHLVVSPIDAQDYEYYLQRISWASV